ncbi:AMP-binding enzyme, partial [Mycobacterium tuberculosis]|uniref:AMP-binding enzyme n=1 Tax=Mycobacterium tuberculosis TaxID=1773 RepID=UPI003CC80026
MPQRTWSALGRSRPATGAPGAKQCDPRARSPRRATFPSATTRTRRRRPRRSGRLTVCLKGHPDVFDALVVGVPDPRYGQQVAAVVEARPGCRPSLAELDSFVRSEIAGYKVPR